ncbi:acyl carrier protein [Paenibacillus tarimensis]|uniref:acyl carrier protein n=1 Tax=Paenibacillus tarimensis TaxID=416012 RepID=UPI001F321C7B|nr:acyl carrier protein [Paenibacillus tarimensis]MCF2945182.1 acyl carrier protein [Paenibacillus tarimensis]
MDIGNQVRMLMSVDGCGILQAGEIQDTRTLYDIGLDSLRFMELVILLEERFGIELPDDILEVEPETMVSDIIGAVEACLIKKREQSSYGLTGDEANG